MKRFLRPARPAPAALGKNALRGQGAGEAGSEEICALRIEEMGARGHGIAQSESGPVYAPLSLPGERIEAKIRADRAELVQILEPSPERIPASCPLFGRCGGCQLQHWQEGPYLAWKEQVIAQALAKRGLDVAIEPIVPAWGQGRRRAAFHAARNGRAIDFGFMRRDGAGIEPIGACPLLTASLGAKIPDLRKLAAALVPEKGEIVLQCLETLTGLDVNVRGAGQGPLQPGRLAKTSAAVLEADIARLSFEGDAFLAPRRPLIQIGLASLEPPPGAFAQATQAGEDTIAKLVEEALAGAGVKSVGDLFCGMGTFALRLAQTREVLAVESDASMLLALRAGAEGCGGRLKPITVLRRDLLRTPLSALEMKRIEAIVLDPPRSGARLQAEQIAASKVSLVVSVSCDAMTFARDAKVLKDGGFRLTRLCGVDQFRWSPHIELVGKFVR